MNPTLFLIFVCAAGTLFAFYKVVAPFLEDRREQLRLEILDEELEQLEELVARKSVLVQTLRDIEFDYETGKLSDEDYERLKKTHEHRAVKVMRQLDELRGGVDLDEQIDSALEERLAERARSRRTDSAETRADRESIACPECDKELEAEARFCSRCGTPIGDDETPDERRNDFEETDGEDEPEETAGDPNGAGRDGSESPVTDLRSEAAT